MRESPEKSRPFLGLGAQSPMAGHPLPEMGRLSPRVGHSSHVGHSPPLSILPHSSLKGPLPPLGSQSPSHQHPHPTPFFPQVEVPLQYYTGRTVYKLDTFNSITIREGQIYNLLEDPFGKERLRKEIKCNCSQSRCRAKYCICYSKGKKCGEECGCTNCGNTSEPIRLFGDGVLKGCKCEKSGCRKNYCECRRDGEFCGDKCRCVGCKNKGPQGEREGEGEQGEERQGQERDERQEREGQGEEVGGARRETKSEEKKEEKGSRARTDRM